MKNLIRAQDTPNGLGVSIYKPDGSWHIAIVSGCCGLMLEWTAAGSACSLCKITQPYRGFTDNTRELRDDDTADLRYWLEQWTGLRVEDVEVQW